MDPNNNKNKMNSYKHLAQFSVEEKDLLSFFDTVLPDGTFNQNLVFEITAKKDCLFSLYLHYAEDAIEIPISKQIQGKMKEGKFYGYIELLKEYEEIIISIDKMHSESKFSIYVKTSIIDSDKKINLNMPSSNNYDIKGTTNTINPTLSIKIKNISKDLYKQGKKVVTFFYVEAENDNTMEDRLNIIAYPNVDHFELIHPNPNKYIYNSLSQSKEGKTIFTLKKQKMEDNILVVEISSCQGNFGYKLYNSLNESKLIPENDTIVTDIQGKKTIVKKIGAKDEYYLSVYGLKEDEMLFNEYNNNTSDIDFLMYYYTTNEEAYSKVSYDAKIDYKVESPGNIILSLPNLVTVNAKNNKNKLDDLTITLVMTENPEELNYMGSICFLSKKIDDITNKNLYYNYTIKIDKTNNKIEIDKLDKNKIYYLNVLITNRKTGQIFAMEPIEVIPNKFFTRNVLVTMLIVAIIILLLVIFYFYRKYRITKAIVSFENSDIKKMSSIPKSINELKKIQDEKNKKAKEKYNSLTEDSGDI